MYEAIQRLRFEAFLESWDKKYQESTSSLIETMQDSITEGKFQECMKGQLFDDIIIKYEVYVAESSTKSN
jgi:transposase-like protein